LACLTTLEAPHSVPEVIGLTGRVVVTFPAQIDPGNVDAIGQELVSALASGVRMVIADLTATVGCDPSGARMLALSYLQAADNDTELRLAVPGPAVLQALELTGLDRLTRIYPSLDQALRLTDDDPFGSLGAETACSTATTTIPRKGCILFTYQPSRPAPEMRALAMTRRWMSLVPSPMAISGASR
jgi:anti-sigma B factor antagonist